MALGGLGHRLYRQLPTLPPHARPIRQLWAFAISSSAAGIFSPTNLALKCPNGGYSFAEPAPKLVQHQGH